MTPTTPPATLSPPARKRRERILGASARCIARSGVRGLRVQEVAREAGVSSGLLYYHFGDRTGLLTASLEFVSERAARYASGEGTEGDALAELRSSLLDELQDPPEVIENSSAWGELRASAIFEQGLRAPLATATREWVDAIVERIGQAQEAGLVPREIDAPAAATTLTALVEGLSNRWLSGSLELAEARRLLDAAIGRVLEI